MAKVRLIYSGIYYNDLKRLIVEDPNLRDKIEESILLFKNNPDDTRIRNHSLHKSMDGKWAFSITGDIRIVYVWVGKKTVRFLAIGGHEEVYLK